MGMQVGRLGGRRQQSKQLGALQGNSAPPRPQQSTFDHPHQNPPTCVAPGMTTSPVTA